MGLFDALLGNANAVDREKVAGTLKRGTDVEVIQLALSAGVLR